jgi:hypothetical protein
MERGANLGYGGVGLRVGKNRKQISKTICFETFEKIVGRGSRGRGRSVVISIGKCGFSEIFDVKIFEFFEIFF